MKKVDLLTSVGDIKLEDVIIIDGITCASVAGLLNFNVSFQDSNATKYINLTTNNGDIVGNINNYTTLNVISETGLINLHNKPDVDSKSMASTNVGNIKLLFELFNGHYYAESDSKIKITQNNFWNKQKKSGDIGNGNDILQVRSNLGKIEIHFDN